MKSLILLLFPLFLQAQVYRLDSTKYTSPHEFIIERYTYTTQRDFTVYHNGYHTSGTIYNDFREYKDSLLVKWTIISEEGDSIFWNYTYDDLDRLTSELDFKEDTLTHSDRYTYFENTDLITSRESYSIQHKDTINHNYEWNEYDDLFRTTFSSGLLLRYDTIYFFEETFNTYPDDFVSYGLRYSRDHTGKLDTSLSKTYYYPDQYFGDTLRHSYDFFRLALDSSIIDADNNTTFTWGDFNHYEDAGDWTYLHGVIYGNYQEYQETPEGFSFIYYESPWVDADPVNWRYDILHLRNKFATGTITVNEIGLPLQKKIHWLENNTDAQTEYFYTKLTGIRDFPIPKDLNLSCRIINQLDPGLIYYDMSGRIIKQISNSQYLLEKRQNEINRVLYLSNQ
jgi:YD repeat-containing protein